MTNATAVIFAVLLLTLNIWVTRRVLRSDESPFRKSVLVAGIWLVPFIGALMANGYCPVEPVTTKSKPLPAGFQDAPAPEEIQLQDGPPFKVLDHAGAVDGIPLLDWKALDAWEALAVDEDKRREAKNLGRRAWLLHLRDSIGPHFNLYESNEAFVLSSLEPHLVVATAQYVATTRRRIRHVLQDLARFPSNEKAILLVLDDDDSYYHYVSTYHPQDGDFALSGGMFIDFGCPHFVAKRLDLTMVEPVIAHEMTHMAVSYLALPKWLDEGIAVNVERRLTGEPPMLYTPQELHEKHLRFWDDYTIQEFWTGQSFQRGGDGNLLSYELARILVAHMGRDWASFAKFVAAADRVDAGADAARNQLSLDLGAAVRGLLELEPIGDWSPKQLAAATAEA
jgi:hypothetical protein